MIDWEKSKSLFGTEESNLTKKSRLWFKCANCGKEYAMAYKTVMERKRCKRNKCKFCANRVLTDQQREERTSGYYTKKSRDKSGRKELYKIWLNKKEGDIELFVKSKVYSSLNEDKRTNRIGNITTDFIMGMLEAQSWRCKLSNINLLHRRSLNSLSIDRISNDSGHTKGNVQLICRGLNIAKNKHTNDDIIQFLNCLCKVDKFITERFSRDYLSVIKRNSQQRDKSKNLDNNLTTNGIIKIFERQNGLCSITGLPMACYQHPCFSCSIDRLNNDLGHTEDNVHLVLKCINRAKSKFAVDQVIKWLNDIKECYGKSS